MGKAKQQKSASLLFKSISTPDTKTVKAVVAASTLDRDGDIIDVASMRIPLKGGGHIYARELTGNEAIDIPLFVNHERDVRAVIGSASSAMMNSAGELEVTFKFSSLQLAQDMFTLISEGHLDNAWSHTIIYDPYRDVADGVIYDAEVIEVSLVYRGSNQDARLLAVSKSLQKGLKVSTPEQETKRAELEKHIKAAEALKKELEEEPDTPETTVETPETPEAPETPDNPEPESPEQPLTPAAPEQPEKAEPEQPEMPEPKPKEETPEVKPKEEEKPVNPQTATAQKQAAAAPSKVEEPRVETPANPDAYKVLAVKQFKAFVNKDYYALKSLNDQAMKLDTASELTKALKKKEISYSDGSPLYLAEQLDRDIDKQYADVGNVGSLVNRINLTQSPKYRKIVRTEGVAFVPQGFKGKKTEDKPTWGSFTLEPKPFALIVAWSDHVNEDAMVNTYNEIVLDIAEAKSSLEDKLILTFETVTANETVYPTQGLTALLGASRTVTYDLTAAGFLAAVANAWGKLHSSARKNLSMVMNGSELGQVGLITDTLGRPLFVVDQNGFMNLGALGRVRIVTSDELSAGEIVLGNYKKYDLANKGTLQLKGSSDATVGELNLFEEDASALRAVVRSEGGTARTNAFVKMTRDTGESS